MGLESSKMVPVTEEELEHVQNSWKVVMENAEENGMFIFKTLVNHS